MDIQTKGTTITLTDVFWKFVAAWKMVLLFVILGVLLFQLYIMKYYDSKKLEYEAEQNEYEHITKEYEKRKKIVLDFNEATINEKNNMAEELATEWERVLSSDQLAVIDNALSIKKLINDNNEYQKKSILMNLDPYHVNTLYMIFEIVSENTNLVNMLNSYSSYLVSDEGIADIATATNWDIEGLGSLYYAELFTCSSQNGNQFVITVQCRPEENIMGLSEAIEKTLRKKEDAFNSSIGKHNIVLLSKTWGERVNSSLATTKNSIQNQVVSYNNQIYALKAAMEKTPEQYNLYMLKGGLDDGNISYIDFKLPIEPEVKKPSRLLSKTTYLLIGAFLGIAVSFIVVYLKMIFSNRIQKADELKGIYNIHVAGYVYRSRRLKLDSLIARLYKGKKALKDNDIALSILSSDIVDICKCQGIVKTSIIGSSIDKKDENTINKLSLILKEKGLDIIASGDILSSNNIRSKILESDSYILAETIAKASYRDIDREKQLLDSMGKKTICAFSIE